MVLTILQGNVRTVWVSCLCPNGAYMAVNSGIFSIHIVGNSILIRGDGLGVFGRMKASFGVIVLFMGKAAVSLGVKRRSCQGLFWC